LKDLYLKIDLKTMPVAKMGEYILEYYLPILKNRYDDHPKRAKDLEHLLTIMVRYAYLDQFLADMAIEPPNISIEDTFLVDSLLIQSNDMVGNASAYIRINVVVSDSFFFPIFSSVTNESFILEESNVGNIGNQNPAGMMTFHPDIAPGFAPIFDGSIIIGTQTSPARVGRYVYEEEYMLAESDMNLVDVPDVKTKVVKSKCNPLTPFPPGEWKWWWLTIEYYDKVFYSGSISSPERFIKKWHIKIYKNPMPAWWDALADPSTTNPACRAGVLVDFDCPYDIGLGWNIPGFDETLNLLYQQGYGSGTEPNYFAGLAYHDASPPLCARIAANDIYVYPQKGYDDDSLWSLMNRSGFGIDDTAGYTRVTDYNQVMVGKQIPFDLAEVDTIEMQFLIAASIYGLDSLRYYVKMFVCGNANRDPNAMVNLSDVIEIANYKFKSGPETFLYLSDVNGDCLVNSSDIIYLANYYFGKPGFETLNCDCQEEW